MRLKKRCILCDGEKGKVLFTKTPYPIVRCSQCGLTYVDSIIKEDELDAIYGENYFKRGGKYKGLEKDPCDERAMNAHLQNEIARAAELSKISDGGRILDVGCGVGGFLSTLPDGKWEKYGVERSEYGAKCAAKKVKGNIIKGLIEEADLPGNSFDVVAFWDVLEHLQDPVKSLSCARRLLKEGGSLMISTGDAKSLLARVCGRYWHLFTPPQHLYFFDKRSIEKLLKKSGFDIIKICYMGRHTTLEFVIFKLLEVSGLSTLSRFFNRVRKILPLGKIKLYVNTFDIMTIHAVKK